MKLKQQTAGFTIVELMIATLVFSVVLLLCVFGLLQIGKQYYRGITSSRTQAVARAATDNIVQAIQYGSGNVGKTPTAAADNEPGDQNTVTIANRRYTYTLGRQLADGSLTANDLKIKTNVGLKEEIMAPDGRTVQSTRELLGKNMWLSQFSIQPNQSVFDIKIKVLSGSLDLVEDNAKKKFNLTDSIFEPGFILDQAHCRTGIAGSQFCALSGLYTQAYKRL